MLNSWDIEQLQRSSVMGGLSTGTTATLIDSHIEALKRIDELQRPRQHLVPPTGL